MTLFGVVRYEDRFLRVIDIVDESKKTYARRVIFRNEFGTSEKEYRKVFTDPVNIKKAEAEE